MNIEIIITSAAIGAITSALFAFLAQWLTQRSEEQRQIRELAFRAAIENWKYSMDCAKAAGGGLVEPLDIFLIHAVQLTVTMTGKPMSPEEVRKQIRHTLAATKAAQQEIDEYNKEFKKV